MSIHQQPTGVSCTLNASEDYASTVDIRSIQGLPDHVVVQVSSQWHRARKPEEQQVRFKMIVSQSDLTNLHRTIGAFISQTENNNKHD